MKNIVDLIAKSKKVTPVKVYLWEKQPIAFPGCKTFQGQSGGRLIFGDWEDIFPVLEKNRDAIADYIVESDRRFSAIPLTKLHELSTRVEPGAVIRDGVHIGSHTVIMMGAILNIGASVGDRTMIDMGAILGGRATVGRECHIGAGAVLAGVIEPVSAQPVVVGDRVLIGANAVILEGVQIGDDAVVGAGAVVTRDVPPRAVVVGCPARIVKFKDKKTADKTGLTDGLR